MGWPCTMTQSDVALLPSGWNKCVACHKETAKPLRCSK